MAGKFLDVPAYQLLGGNYRDEVRTYCDCHTEDEADPEACADEAERVVHEFGYDALKFDLGIPAATRRTGRTATSDSYGEFSTTRWVLSYILTVILTI